MPRAELRLAWKTQAGHRHQLEGLDNEDAVFVTDQHPVFEAVLMVADGMGGHPDPREASDVAVDAARRFLFDPERLHAAGDIPRALGGAVRVAGEAVRALGRGRRGRSPGTTLSIAVIAEGTLHLAHVGDGSIFLMRGGQVRPIAGGEGRRNGNRPSEFLGRDTTVTPELRRIALAEGDRLLLCTDGLTRYFREAGPEALERVLGRTNVDIQTIASQLTAHSRPDEYDDDTTVALAEVAGAGSTTVVAAAPASGRRAARPLWLEERDEPAVVDGPRRRGPVSLPAVLVAGFMAAALSAGAFLAGWLLGLGRAGGTAAAGRTTAPPPRKLASEPDLRRLPAGNLVLLDALGGRVFLLPTRTANAEEKPLDLQALKMGPDGRLDPAGTYHLDPRRGELTDASGHKYPVTVDASGVVRALSGGTLAVESRPSGANVEVDGERVGAAPRSLTLPEGRHRVRASGRNWSSETEVAIAAGRTVTIILGPR